MLGGASLFLGSAVGGAGLFLGSAVGGAGLFLGSAVGRAGLFLSAVGESWFIVPRLMKKHSQEPPETATELHLLQLHSMKMSNSAQYGVPAPLLPHVGSAVGGASLTFLCRRKSTHRNLLKLRQNFIFYSFSQRR